MPPLNDLYREIVMDHYRTPRNRGELPTPPAQRADGHNPLCGDEISVYVLINGDVIEDIKLTGHGCSISQASSSMMSAAVKGRSLEQTRELVARFKELMTSETADSSDQALRELGEIAALSGVSKFPVRIKCATLAWNTLTQALDDAPQQG
ncbi:MAG: SUF system NifU family Fe-S cluster assembly protein [Acidobacteria bacterium]|nr:SUF system NifU family Fe-S cluster assembly protein [Acidobacteriota bacterium]